MTYLNECLTPRIYIKELTPPRAVIFWIDRFYPEQPFNQAKILPLGLAEKDHSRR